MRLLWSISLLGAALGGLTFVFDVSSANSAPQEAAAAAIAMALAVIPYCFARAYSEMKMAEIKSAKTQDKKD